MGQRSSSMTPIPPPALGCSQCRRTFPVSDGILRFIDNEAGEGAGHPESAAEMRRRDQEAGAYDHRFPAVRNAIEIPPCLKAVDLNAGDVVVELGCGTGRFTSLYVELVARVVAIDFSFQSLKVLKAKLPATVRDRILLVQADITSPPLAKQVFTKAVSFQVFEHLRTPSERETAVMAACELLIPSESLTCSVYNWSRQKRKFASLGIGDNTAKEGRHSEGAIYYYNFEEPELRKLLDGSGFRVDTIRGLQMQVRGIGRLGGLAVLLDRVMAASPLGIKHGHLLLAHATVR